MHIVRQCLTGDWLDCLATKTMGKECQTRVSRRLWEEGNTTPLKATAWEARGGLARSADCPVPRRRYSTGKQGARGVLRRLECTYPTTPCTPPSNKEVCLGITWGEPVLLQLNLAVVYITGNPNAVLAMSYIFNKSLWVILEGIWIREETVCLAGFKCYLYRARHRTRQLRLKFSTLVGRQCRVYGNLRRNCHVLFTTRQTR